MKDRHYMVIILIIMSLFMGCMSKKININSCSYDTLTKVNGIGQIRAELIIKNRPYKSLKEVEQIKGVGEQTVKKLKIRTGVY